LNFFVAYDVILNSNVLLGDQVENEMGGACSTNGGEDECQKERDHWEDQDVGGWTILKWILER
jgi:hypothetical protein